jgi:phosphoribosylaminoimidazole (AIR) synthetase
MDKTFNMGIGMAVVVDKNMAYYTKSILNEYYETHIIGDIV